MNERRHDLKNRIELRRMMSEYMSGALKPPIFYKDEIIAADNFGPNAEIEQIEETIYEPPSSSKRFALPVQPSRKEIADDSLNYDDFPLKGIFREQQQPKYIIENIEDQFDPRNNDPNELRRRIFKASKSDEEPGYAEGGVIFEPNAFTSTNHRKCKMEIAFLFPFMFLINMNFLFHR